jgi:hypothetical protein
MRQLIPALALMALAVMSGCNKPKSPVAVAGDVASAQRHEAAAVAAARNDATKNVDGAEQKVDEKAADLNNAQATGAYDVALAQADGDHKVAVAKCEMLAGDDQRRCKDRADADYDAVKAGARARETAQKQ